MSEALDRKLIRRIRFTPFRDLLRGRLTGRLDFKRQIETAELPQEAKALLLRVVRRTRVWSLERAEIADELISHFADGLAAEVSAQELIGNFGDERTAARLLGRAKRRNRSMTAKVISGLRWLTLALFVYFLGLVVCFYEGKPSPKLNYLEILNRPALQARSDERAWPLYHQALIAIDEWKGKSEIIDAKPDDPYWPEKSEWLRQHHDLFELIRRATERPTLGFIYGPGGSARDPALWQFSDSAAGNFGENSLESILVPYLSEARFIVAGPLLFMHGHGAPAGDPSLWPVSGYSKGLYGRDSLVSIDMASHLNEARFLASLLADDAKLARQEADGSRLVDDIIALVRFADQLHECHIIVSELVSLAIRDMALTEIQSTLTQTPDQLMDAELQSLAHRLAKPDTDPELINLDGERMVFYDVMQRVYTDDGHGDGRFTADGMRMLRSMSGWNLPEDPVPAIAWPASFIRENSRRRVLEEYDRHMDSSAAEIQKPRRLANWAPLREQQERWKNNTGVNKLHDLLLGIFSSSYSNIHTVAERYLGQRDGILVGIALELYRRQHGDYPDSLEPLTPLFLPAMPIDRITGGPLHYRLIDGHPIVYSVGADRDDDGGRFPPTSGGNPDLLSAANWDVAPEKAADGDWVLYPKPPLPSTD